MAKPFHQYINPAFQLAARIACVPYEDLPPTTDLMIRFVVYADTDDATSIACAIHPVGDIFPPTDENDHPMLTAGPMDLSRGSWSHHTIRTSTLTLARSDPGSRGHRARSKLLEICCTLLTNANIASDLGLVGYPGYPDE